MNSTLPKLSVLMPVYNGEKYIKYAIDSILKQTFTNFEFLIIDDGSQDKTCQIVASYNDPRINFIRNHQNRGLTYTLNLGLSLAKGEYIARMDCDDISLPERLSKQISFLEKNPNIGLLGSSVTVINAKGERVYDFIFPQNHSEIRWFLCFYCPIAHPTVIFRKHLVMKDNTTYSSTVIQGREMYSAEDYDLWRRLSLETELHNLPDILLQLRKHEKNTTNIFRNEHIKNSVLVNRQCIKDMTGTMPEYDLAYASFCQKLDPENLYRVTDLTVRIYNSWRSKESFSKKSMAIVNRDFCIRLSSLVHLVPDSSILRFCFYLLQLKVDRLLVLSVFALIVVRKISPLKWLLKRIFQVYNSLIY